CMQALRFPWTF
nr:immunoglobulin light chain junction region [Macaca mulatta]MOW52912.1 immunoglobulin light chain junction region [Macaca mulatta]MOW53104.1 immunoglobulin light chain junction region [Macaca mulatta]MOW53640.1 immunoglobulin light chain junction region [Macaca mulatta]MOW54019.1 immunoglobulin light chain junction region [Macaca mulatta]